MIGQGKYDKACTAAFESTKADTCILMIINGEHGHGFSVVSSQEEHVARLPQLMRIAADMVEEQQRTEGN